MNFDLTFLEAARLKAAMRRLDLVSPSDVVDWAIDQLTQGQKSATLVELASVGMPLAVDVDNCLDRLLEELGASRLEDKNAGMIVARFIAWEVSEGVVSPIEGARRIWWDVAGQIPETKPRLREFVGLASEWDDSPQYRDDYAEDIRGAFQRLSLEGTDTV